MFPRPITCAGASRETGKTFRCACDAGDEEDERDGVASQTAQPRRVGQELGLGCPGCGKAR